MTIAIVVHGGAWEIPDALVPSHEAGCIRAAQLGHEVLRGGGSATDAVEAAIRDLENDPSFDAGYGAFLNRDGVAELDAGIMDGTSLRSGAVAGVTRVRHPLALARMVMESQIDCLVVGRGAEALAEELGIELVAPESLVSDFAREYWQRHGARDPRAIFASHPTGTVGAVALDSNGRIAAGTSTGGLPGKRPGRVGDSPLIGCGFYADSASGGASATGHGEAIMTVGLSRLVVSQIAAGADVVTAVRVSVDQLASARIGGRGGVIALDGKGQPAVAFNTGRLARAWIDGEGRQSSGVDH